MHDTTELPQRSLTGDCEKTVHDDILKYLSVGYFLLPTVNNSLNVLVISNVNNLNLNLNLNAVMVAVAQMAKGNGERWYGHMLRRDDGHVLRKTLEFEVKGKKKRR